MKIVITIETPNDDDRHDVRINTALADLLARSLRGNGEGAFDSGFPPYDFGRIGESLARVTVTKEG